MFKLIGLGLAAYTFYAAQQGHVVCKAGPGARTVHRDESPEYFWVVIAIYTALSLALIAIF
jgi:hypothetical protein